MTAADSHPDNRAPENGTLDAALAPYTNGAVHHDVDEQPPVGRYGWGSFTPDWLQRLHNAKWLLAVLSLCSLTQGMLINALVPVSLSSLERRFHLTSVQTGVIVSTSDVAVIACLIPITHIGGRGHKARWLATGMLLLGLGALICVVPQFISPPYDGYIFNSTATSDELCRLDGEITQTDTDYDRLLAQIYYWIMILGQALTGFGMTPIYTLGITYLDECVTEETSPIYLAIFLSASIFGPALGFIGGGAMLRIYGDWGKVDIDRVEITPEDPRWYGAWWLGYVVAGLMCLFGSFLMFGFARRLPDAPKNRQVQSQMKFATNVKQFWLGIKSVFRSTAFMYLCLVEIFESVLSVGVVNFFPKILQSFFSISASKASAVTGATIVPAAVIGNLLGGFLIRRLKLQSPGMLLFSVVADCSSLLLGTGFLLHCPIVKMAGVSVPYPSAATPLAALPNLSYACNDGCHCRQSMWEPVCDRDHGVAYYSPCYAGCEGVMPGRQHSVYTACACVPEPVGAVSAAAAAFGTQSRVVSGFCDDSCNLLYPFIFLFASFVLVAFSTSIPIQQAELRLVPFEQRSLAFGVRWIFIRVLGTIPGPILFGKFVDSACLVWRVDADNNRQDCPLYDNHKMSLFIVVCGTILKVLVIICLCGSWFHSRKPVIHPMENGDVQPDVAPIAVADKEVQADGDSADNQAKDESSSDDDGSRISL